MYKVECVGCGITCCINCNYENNHKHIHRLLCYGCNLYITNYHGNPLRLIVCQSDIVMVQNDLRDAVVRIGVVLYRKGKNHDLLAAISFSKRVLSLMHNFVPTRLIEAKKYVRVLG